MSDSSMQYKQKNRRIKFRLKGFQPNKIRSYDLVLVTIQRILCPILFQKWKNKKNCEETRILGIEEVFDDYKAEKVIVKDFVIENKDYLENIIPSNLLLFNPIRNQNNPILIKIDWNLRIYNSKENIALIGISKVV